MEFKALTMENIIKRAEETKKGTFHRIKFFSNPKTTDGTILFKVATSTIRTKIDTTKMKDYNEPTYHTNENCTYLLSNCIKHNNKTGSDLMKVAPLWDTYQTEYFDSHGNPMAKELAESMLKDKKKNEEKPLFITVNCAKILEF